MPTMQISLGLPTHRVDLGAEFVSAAAVTELARAAEDGGFDAVYVTEHPFPDARWLEHRRPSRAGPVRRRCPSPPPSPSALQLQTNLVVLAYRNPFLAAKAIASLDVLSGGRTIIGIGAGYLEGEFRALGVDPARRNELTDEAIRAMTAAWSGEEIELRGRGLHRRAATSCSPGRCSRRARRCGSAATAGRAMRRVAELADGWIPMPTTGMADRRRLGAAEDGVDRQRRRRSPSASPSCGRCSPTPGATTPPTVAFTPPSLLMTRSTGADPAGRNSSTRPASWPPPASRS